MIVVYGYGKSSICGGSRGSDYCAYATGSDVTIPDRKRLWPEVTGVIAFPCADFSCVFSSYYCSSAKCWSKWPQRCSLGCMHAQPDFSPFFGCFRICCVVLHVAFSLCGISKSTFDSLSHPIEGHFLLFVFFFFLPFFLFHPSPLFFHFFHIFSFLFIFYFMTDV